MLAGDLGDFPLPDILRLLWATSKSGRLEVAARDDHGRIELVDGRLVDASPQAHRRRLARRLVGGGTLDADAVTAIVDGSSGAATDRATAERLVERDVLEPDAAAEVLHEHVIDAVFELLGWSEGDFRFDAVDVPEPRWSWSVDEVLADAGSRLEGWEAVLARTGDGADVVTVQAADDRAVTISAAGWQLLGLADGRRTVDDLAELSGRGRFDTRRLLAELLDLEVVEIVPASQGATVARLLAAHAALDRVEGTSSPDAPAAAAPDALAASASEHTPVGSDDTSPASVLGSPEPEVTPSELTVETTPADAAADEPTPWTGNSDAAASAPDARDDDVAPTASDRGDPADGEEPPGVALPPADRPAMQPPVDEELLVDLVAGIEAMR